VIVANYCAQKQAQEYAKWAGKKENVILSVVKDKKLYRVIAGSFNSQQAATAKIKELHKHKEFAEAWVLYKPQK
jgi:SPOR domain